MDSDNKKTDQPDTEAPQGASGSHSADTTAQAPADALSRTPEDLQEEQDKQDAANPQQATPEAPVKKVSLFKRILRKVNVYFLIFGVIVAVAGSIAAVNYFNSQKDPVEAALKNQSLSEDSLKQLANTDATVGNTSQTLTIQGNAVINGQTLIRGALNVAGDIQSGGRLQVPSVTVSGSANLGEAQINTLQVATNAAIQGSTSLRDLTVSGAASFSGTITASQITVSRLLLSGNATVEVPNHLNFSGPAPSRTINATVLGGGGSASVDGSDMSGTVNINSGNNPTAGCFIRINFSQAFTKTPHVVVSPIGSGAGQLGFYVERNTTGFSICSTTTPPNNQVFAFDYFIAGQ
jgi:cytoskeletal protein CcmA (bactofilin family)